MFMKTKKKPKGLKLIVIVIAVAVVMLFLAILPALTSRSVSSLITTSPAAIRKTRETADLINQNSELGACKLLEAYTENMREKLIDSGAYNIDNYMSDDYYWPDDDVESEMWSQSLMYIFSGYPDDESPFFLTGIEFSSSDYNIFGITAGNTLTDAIKTMEENGFERISADSNMLEKTGITIKLNLYFDEAEEMRVKSIEIDVYTKYLGNRIY